MRIAALTAATTCAVLLTGGLPAGAAPAAAPGTGVDFNGDGYPDLAIGAHTAPVGEVARAGVVAVAYGSPDGLRYDTASVVSQAGPQIPDEPTDDGRWRQVTAAGDLDGDGYDDLVVNWVERTTVLWGGPDGLGAAGTKMPSVWIRDQPRLLGGGMGVGDVNNDGVDDLVSRGHDGFEYGTAVLLGPLDRGTGAPAGSWFADTVALADVHTSTLYVGDMTGDGIDDIAVLGTVPLGSGATSGVVLRGSRTGLVKGSTFNTPHRYDTSYPYAFGDLNRDGYGDLVTGWPQDNLVHVVYGGPQGLSSTRAQRTYSQADSGVPGTEEEGDQFGSAVAIGDTDRDGYDDLVIGASYETGTDTVATAGAGAITVLRGSATGLTTTGAKSFTQLAAGVPGTSEVDDHFGAALELVDTDKDGDPELYVGGNGEDGWRGQVWKLPTGPDGVVGAGSTTMQLGTLGGPAGGNFGYRMIG